MSELAQTLSSWNDHVGDLKDAYRGRPLRCFAYIVESGTCIRTNNIYSYCDANRQISRLMPALAPHCQIPPVNPNANVDPKAQVSSVKVGTG